MRTIIDNIISVYNHCYEKASSLQIYPCNILENINSEQCSIYCNLPRKERIDLILWYNDIKNTDEYYNVCNRGTDQSHVISAKEVVVSEKRRNNDKIVVLRFLICASMLDKVYGQINNESKELNDYFERLVNVLFSLQTRDYQMYKNEIKTLEEYINSDQRIEHISIKEHNNTGFSWYLYRVQLLYSKCSKDKDKEDDISFLTQLFRQGKQNY